MSKQFTKYLSPQTPNIKQAVDSFTTTIFQVDPSHLEEELGLQWRSLLKVAAQTEPDKQEHLTIFIRELRNVPNPADKVEIWGEVFKWENLPLWGPNVREMWDVAEPDPAKVTKENSQEWINQNGLLAHLTSISRTRHDPLDFALYGIWAMRTAFEESADGVVKKGGLQVEAAKVWMKYAGDVLKQRSESDAGKGEVWEGAIAREGFRAGEEGKSWRGLNAERWNYWTDALRKIEES